jgi:acetoin utilization deacetylase AcuC-like enzyme
MLSSSIKQLAKELCGGRSIFFLEGGYNLESLSSSVADTFRAFLDEPSLAAQFDDRGDAARRTDHSMKSWLVLVVCVGHMRSENEILGQIHATYKKPV